ncbi:MAG: citryl-CoA lyase [Nanoarchaeota archaeon]|nr:citryl-CoA lyase [DPANN group archaeon]MBL7116271.1 citryl-CoA lyase [Nanoarchaeota archaeon]
MEFKTRISKLTKDDMIIRGEKLSSLIKENSFTDSIFLLLRNRKPTQKESKIFSAMLISIIDHGMGTTSSLTTRFVTSTGNSLNTAVGAGVLALGDYHGGAIEKAMIQFKEVKKAEKFVSKNLKDKKIIFGYGHKIYKEEDPRVRQIISLCRELNYPSKYISLAINIEKSIKKKKGKKICLNIDGLIAAVLLEMGFSPKVGKGIFIIGRVPGLIAQAIEEKEEEKPVRRVDETDIDYKR